MRLQVVAKVIIYSVFAAVLVFPISTGAAGLNGVSFKDEGIHTVVIDAGHGGHDSGCVGHKNSYEKHVALAVALYLGSYIEEYLPDVKVIYTRKTDVFVELEERAAIANRNNADLFISIHCNAASPAAFGAETYIMGLHKTDGNLDVAKRENSVMGLEDNYMERYGFDFNSAESYIMLSLTQNAYQEQSAEFAALIQEQFRERVGRHDRGVKAAGFWVLWRTTMPSVLIETGFLTNAKEEAFLVSKQGQEYMASAIFRAFRDYKHRVENRLVDLDDVETPLPPAVDPQLVDDGPRDGNLPKTTYRVQLLVSSKKYNSFDRKFAGVDHLIVEDLQSGENTLYRYSTGPYSSMESAEHVLDNVRRNGFGDAFITVYEEGYRVEILKNNEIQ